MKTLPVCIFTKNRTGIAELSVSKVRENLSCSGRRIHLVLCDDGSRPGHLDRLEKAAGGIPVTTANVHGRGLGASMNTGLCIGYSMSDVVLRMEDDWILEKPLDIGRWADMMDSDSSQVGVVRMGMMFREPDELVRFGDPSLGLLRMRPRPGRTYNVNNQVALVHRQVYELCGMYREDLDPQGMEKDFGDRFNRETDNCSLTPYVCWPAGWATKIYDHPSMYFIHAGRSTLGHDHFTVPERYRKYNA